MSRVTKVDVEPIYESIKELHQQIDQGIESNFLKRLDIYIQKNWKNLKCNEISYLYWNFFKALKPFKGNSNGFTGLSEFLIIRTLLHKLGDWKVKKHSKDTMYFQSKKFNNLYVIPEYPFKYRVNGKNRPKYVRPDIVICESNTSPFEEIRRLIGVIEVKVYLYLGQKTVEEVFNKLKAIKANHPQMKALLIIFDKLSNKPSSLEKLKEIRMEKSNKWFSYCSLKDTQVPLSNILEENIDLS